MCIIILNKSEKVSKSNFQNSLESNPDGFGMAYVTKYGKIEIFKSMSLNWKNLYTRYSKAFEDRNRIGDILLHFRISTCGGINLENTHPFHLSKDLIFCHNGIIQGYGTKKENDTRHFGRDILSHISENDLFFNKAIQKLIENRIGHSKLVFLNSTGESKIYGENLGLWESDGNWYSNTSYQDYSYDFGKSYEECDGCSLPAKSLTYLSEINSLVCDNCKEWYLEKI
jgi:predicted glutamine amidotransferase